MTDETPSRLGKYDVIRTLGRGGMAEVLLARLSGADGFEREVVIKRILTHYSSEKQFVDMFRDEARITAQLRHGNIAQVLEFGEDAGQYFLVLEYVDGPALHHLLDQARLRRLRLPYPVIAYILSEIARALDYAHRKRGVDGELLGIVHRDISPSNTLLSKEGEVKLADFGIARARERIISTTSAGGVKGKLSYMAAEMLSGKAEPRSDLFSLGAMAWEMCAGEPPLEANTFPERVVRILGGVKQRLRAVVPDVPPILDDVIWQLLQLDVEARPARGADVMAALAPLIATAQRPAGDMLAEQIQTLGTSTSAEKGAVALLPATRVATPASKVTGRVLIVERSVTARALVRSAMPTALELVEVDTVEAAIATLQQGRVSLVISQYQLGGGGTGIDLCIHLRSLPNGSKVPFFLVVSAPDSIVELHAANAGVTEVVSKTDPTSLLRRLRERTAAMT